MIFGIGLDVIELQRIEEAVARNARFVERVLTALPVFNLLIFKIICGVGENRTLVQISNSNAFYILSFCLIFVVLLTKNRP